MPSTGWNVFVASLVALVVYIAVQAEMVLLGIVAGTLTFVSGWLLGYAINQDLLDSMELSRVLVAGGVTAFAIVYTLLYTRQQYILGLIVVCLVWFAAWFTSSMGPIKGSTGAMETIDEPRPPAGAEPGEPLHLGGPEEQYNDETNDDGFLGGLLSFGSTDADTAYRTEPENRLDGSEETADGSALDHSRTTTSEESLFGLGIFYEENPAPEAGAEDQPPVRAETDQSAATPEQRRERPDESMGSPADPPEQQRKPAAADHTRPSSTGNASTQSQPTDAGGSDAATASEPRREPVDSPGRDADHSTESYDTSQGASTGASGSADAATDAGTEGDADAGDDDEPPEEHRVDLEDDDSGFIFG